ncbi:hypothetical protein HX882_08000 [Pseudomonas gingeri]|uniref:Uncharacterized protein n=1 Tax=Pseudomonas gingeri TaxID=117681 RepID=A0A7Y8C1R7_9PSED|nr:hypothetical protein [Pseudomonas gingeri]NWB95824.1 hypothetical protein [Pseudomonas gingeri]
MQSPLTLTSQLANLCENTGYLVHKGQTARYRRVADGVYELLGLNEAQELTAAVEPAAEVPVPIDWQSLSTWEARFAFYLEQEPFQIYDRRRRQVYPAQAVQGLEARLSRYFWPSPGVDFVTTEGVLQGFIDQARGAA